MKPQDIGFILIFTVLLILRKPRLLLFAGLTSLILAIPLFTKWIFFTAERLTWYGAAFISVYLLISLVRPNTVK